MKKSNITVIAAVLIAVHIIVFMVVIGSKDKKQPVKKAPVPAKTAAKPAPVHQPDFKVPELKLPEPAPVQTEIIPVDQGHGPVVDVKAPGH